MDLAADRIATRLTVDHHHRRAEVEFSDGQVVTSSLTGRAAEYDGGEIVRTDYHVESGELTITLRWGETASWDIGPAAPPEIPVVYLDQNHWIALACQQWSPEKIEARHREGYARLMALARERAIVLPLSSAHVFETAREDGRPRRELGTTMLQLSRGWQMRHPLKVRREELLCALAAFRPTTKSFRLRPVFTLDPEALFSGSEYVQSPLPVEDLKTRLTWASAVAAVLVEDEREPPATAETWVRAHAAISARLDESNASREEKRGAARAALLSDYADDLTRAATTVGLDSQQLEEWLAISEDGIATMPANGRVQDVIHQRIRNPQHRWHEHDLSDVYFLASAAGYADFLLAENETSHHLRLAERHVPSGARICSTPRDLTDLIEAWQ